MSLDGPVPNKKNWRAGERRAPRIAVSPPIDAIRWNMLKKSNVRSHPTGRPPEPAEWVVEAKEGADEHKLVVGMGRGQVGGGCCNGILRQTNKNYKQKNVDVAPHSELWHLVVWHPY